MPELPEVETVRRGLIPALEGAVFQQVIVRRADLRRPFPENMADRLVGRRVERLGRRAKYLLIYMSDDLVLVIHLGMSGHMTVYETKNAPPPGKHDHVDFITDGEHTIRFTDPRRFGSMDIADSATLESHPLFANLGPEPLSNAFNGPALAATLKGKKGPIKTALLDQTVVAGLGNIYVCEALFRSGLSPIRKAGSIKGAVADRLAGDIVAVLQDAIASGGSSIRDHLKIDGTLGYFQHSFAVYDREGQPCPGGECDLSACGGIKRIVQSGRSTFYCPTKQR